MNAPSAIEELMDGVFVGLAISSLRSLRQSQLLSSQ